MRAAGRAAFPLLAGTLLVLAGCSEEKPEPSPDPLLTAADLGPRKATRVNDLDRIPDGSAWSCAGIESAYLGDEGWKVQGREFANGSQSWVIDSTVMTNPDASAADQLSRFKTANDACLAEKQTVPEVDLGPDRFGYESITDGQTDARRGYALAGDHEIVLVTTYGLDGEDAPSEITRLLDAAVRRAEAAQK